MEHSPEQEASAKLAQHMAVAVQVTEAVIRLRQQQLDKRTTEQEQTAAARRAELTAQHAADRLTWTPALHAEWVQNASLNDLGRAWGSAAGWADTDPAAEAAATRIETRLHELAPTAMGRYADLRQAGSPRVDAMHEVLEHVAWESGQRDQTAVPMEGETTTAGAAEYAAEQAAQEHDAATRAEATPDNPATPNVDEDAEGVVLGADLHRREAGWQEQADVLATDRQVAYIGDLLERSPHLAGDGPTDPERIAQMSRSEASEYIAQLGGGPSTRRFTATGEHAADVAADSHPRDFRAVTPSSGDSSSSASTARGRGKNKSLSR